MLLTILHTVLVVTCILNAIVEKDKFVKVCWSLSCVAWSFVLVSDIFKFIG